MDYWKVAVLFIKGIRSRIKVVSVFTPMRLPQAMCLAQATFQG